MEYLDLYDSNKNKLNKKYYEAYEERYKDVYKNNILWSSLKETKEVLNTIDKYNITKKDNILDLGCGEGRDTIYLLNKGYNVLGIDYSNTVINKCNEITNNKYKDKFIAFDIFKDKLDIKFDFIYSVAVIHMFIDKKDRNKYYNFIYNHLNNNGYSLIISMGDGVTNYKTKKKDSFNRDYKINMNDNKKYLITNTSCNIVDINTLTKELINNNLNIIDIWISNNVPGFTKSICALVKKK